MRKANMTILASVIAIALVAAGVGMGTMAYFSDTAVVDDNFFTAGTIKLGIGNTVTVPVDLTNMKPGDIVKVTIPVTNDGSLPGALSAWSWYDEGWPTGDADNAYPTNDPTNMDAHQFAERLLIQVFTFNDVDLTGQIVDDPAGIPGLSLRDLMGAPTGNYINLADPFTGTKNYYLKFQFDPTAGNEYQNDGIRYIITFELDQLIP